MTTGEKGKLFILSVPLFTCSLLSKNVSSLCTDLKMNDIQVNGRFHTRGRTNRLDRQTVWHLFVEFEFKKAICRKVVCLKVPMKGKIICAYLKGLSKYRRMVFFFLKYLFPF